MGSDNYSGEGRGADSPSESRGGPGAGAGSSSSGGSKGSSPSSGGNNGGLGGPTSNNSGNSSKSSPSKGSSSSGGGLNSAGNRASGAGPGASSNRSTTGGGFGGNSNANGGGSGGGMGGGLNSAGNRASGAGPGASANRSTTGGGFGSQNSRGIGGGMLSDAARRADMAQAARASENASMKSHDTARRADLAQQARAAENASMSHDAQRRADMAQQQRAAENASMKTINDQQRAFMGTISGTESPGYNVAYGGKTFASYAAHPNIATTITSGPNKGKKSTAAGKYQFTKSTWDDQAKKLGLKDFSPQSQDAAAFNLAKEAYAQKTGRSLTADLAAGVDAGKIASALSGSWTSLPGGIEATTTQSRFSREYASNLSKQKGAPETFGRFAATYLGDRVPAKTSAAKQNDPSGLPPGTYRGYDPSGLPAETPASGPTPTGRPTAPAAPRERSLMEKVAAGAIDVGLGMLPGIGTPVSVINGGLALTGNKTLGERAVDSFSNGQGGAGPESGRDRSGGSGREQIAKNTSTVPKKSQETFEDRYIKFVDPTKRPTPAEKWDYSQSGYS